VKGGINMGEIIFFKTREQLEMEKRQRIIEEWNAYKEWERKTLEEHRKKELERLKNENR